jgi:hypothetical protein
MYRKPTGAMVSLHFQGLMYLLEGPPRTLLDLQMEFHLANPDIARRWLREAEKLKLVQMSKGYRNKLIATPTKVLSNQLQNTS